jgi:hypothetical protein
MTLKMTLSQDLVEELGEAVKQIPTPMGADIVVAVVSAVGPSLTIVTTRFFSPDSFRDALHRWCSHSPVPVHLSGERRGSKFSFDLDERTAPEMASQAAEFVARFLETHPDGPGTSTAIKP